MQPKMIGMRELRQHLSKVKRAAEHGQSFLVTVHRKTAFRIEPPEKREKKNIGKRLVEEFKDLRFRSGDKNLSQQIDQIVYDDRR